MIKLQKNTIEAERHFDVVKVLLQRRIENILNKGIKRGKPKVDINISNSFRAYLDSLLTDSELKQLVLCPPESLQGIIATLRHSHPNFFNASHNENYVLRNIFLDHCYDGGTFSKLDFIKKIDIDTCPYCNRNYIYYLSKKSNIKPQIDHFYPSSIYPFLAVSFYNLIPSCQTCNGFGAKEQKDPTIVGLINPYLLDNGTFKFTYKIKSINFLNPLHDKNSVEVKFRKLIQGHLDVFKLDRLYEQHSDHIIELIVKSKVNYSKQYRSYLRTFIGLSFEDYEIDRMVLGNYSKENEIHKRPLAKMYQDIGRELGLIE